ncbi:MAG: hypothetical protein V7604_3089 [Hyphomicrobiales bacterium]|jgi:hypothetical protein
MPEHRDLGKEKPAADANRLRREAWEPAVSKESATRRSTDRAGPLGSLFALALQRHKEGKLAEADGLYREILARDPNHFDACISLVSSPTRPAGTTPLLR